MIVFLLFLAVWSLFLALTRRHLALVVTLTVVALSQNLGTMVALKTGLLPLAEGGLAFYGKEIFLIAAFLVVSGRFVARAILRGVATLKWTERWALLYLLYLFVPLVLGHASIANRLAGYRSLALLPTLYLLGRWIRMAPAQQRRFYRFLMACAVVVAAFGLVEAYVLPQDFWLKAGQEEYYLVKRGRPIQGTLYGNMRFWLPGSSSPIRRVASLTGDPLVSSYILAFAVTLQLAFVISFRRVNLRHLPTFLLIGIALLLTLGRGAILSVVIATGLLVLAGFRPGWFRTLTVTGYVSAIGLVLVFGMALLDVTYGKGHIQQLTAGLERGVAEPFGMGLGTAGSVASGLAKATGNTSAFVGGGDSYAGSTSTQAGLIGLALQMLVLTSFATSAFAQGTADRARGDRLAFLRLGIAGYIAALVITSTVNESGVGFVASGAVFIFAGVLERDAAPVPSRSVSTVAPTVAESPA